MHKRQRYIADIYGKEPETMDEIAEAAMAVISANGAELSGFAWNVTFVKSSFTSYNLPINRRNTYEPGFEGRIWLRYKDRPDFMAMHEVILKTLTRSGSGGGGAYGGLWSKICSAEYQTRTRERPGDYDSEIIHAYPDPQCFSYDYRFFLSDFPGLETSVGRNMADDFNEFEIAQDKEELWAQLKEKYYRRSQYVYTHSFKYEDPETKAADEAFLETYAADYLKKEIA